MDYTADDIKSIIDSYREEIGRDIVFHVPNTQTGLNTLFNPMTDTRYQKTFTDYTVLARVHWTNDEAWTATPGGKFFQGEASAVIGIEDLEIAQAAQVEGGSVTIDDRELTISKIIPVGAPTINRYRLVLVGVGQRPS